jgi:hypothetical protein
LRELMLEAYANPPELIERTRAILR